MNAVALIFARKTTKNRRSKAIAIANTKTMRMIHINAPPSINIVIGLTISETSEVLTLIKKLYRHPMIAIADRAFDQRTLLRPATFRQARNVRSLSDLRESPSMPGLLKQKTGTFN
jgi:hypothetical protein